MSHIDLKYHHLETASQKPESDMTQQPRVGKGQWLISSSPEICVISGLPFLRPLLPNHINAAGGRDKLITCMY